MDAVIYDDILFAVNRWADQNKSNWLEKGIGVNISGNNGISIDLDL